MRKASKGTVQAGAERAGIIVDEIFFVDLPSRIEREAIWDIHLKKCKQDLSKKDIALLAEKSEGFSGAELEQIVVDAMFDTFRPGKPLKLTAEKICKELSQVVPLSIARSASISAMRDWASKNARHASVGSIEEDSAMTVKASTSSSVKNVGFSDLGIDLM